MVVHKSKPIKYQKLCHELRESIACGDYPKGQAMPTERELAAQWKVSRPTVSRAMKELEAEGLIERRQRSGTFVRARAAGERTRIGLFIPWATSQMDAPTIFEKLGSQLSEAATRNDAFIVIGGSPAPQIIPSHESLSAAIKHRCREFIQSGPDGVLYMPIEVPSQQSLDIHKLVTAAFDAVDIPVVLLDRDIERPPARSQYDVVSIDHYFSTFAITEHLIARGCKRIAFAAEKVYSASILERILGYRSALTQHELPHDSKDVFSVSTADASSALELVDAADTYDGIVALNDNVAAFVMQQLQRSGYRIPQDIRITGFDNLPMSQFLSPALTTISQPLEAIAAMAVKTLLERIKNPKMAPMQVRLEGELIVRESCGG